MTMQIYANTFGVDTVAKGNVHMASKHIERMDATAQISAAEATTYTAAQVLGGVIIRDCAGSGRSDVLPTAALLIAALKEDTVGQVIKCLIVNDSDANETITVVAGDGGTVTQIEATRIVPQNTSRMVYIRIDSATAYTVWM
jgi:hypothetical protein